jgi:hypothetical protein
MCRAVAASLRTSLLFLHDGTCTWLERLLGVLDSVDLHEHGYCMHVTLLHRHDFTGKGALPQVNGRLLFYCQQDLQCMFCN